ncbi:hypothetical protein SPH9361_02507 [Sphingobium sp. CECT 9361]|nr:hypothetical protein SPH9361_02507 [Sphingobium sp. CECT 9361]
MRDERQCVFETIGAFLSGSGGKWDWDDFISCSLMNPELDKIRRQAAAIDLPLDAEGADTLKALLVQVEQFTGDDPKKQKPWRVEFGMACGLAVGAVLWCASYLDGGGPFQNLQLILFPAAIGITAVALRNKRKQLGIYDPEIIARNKGGRV